MDTEIYVLYSGSKGNSVLIGCGDDVILIDSGRSARALVCAIEKTGRSIGDVSAVFVTHEHTDHISALDVLLGRYQVPIHITSSSLSAIPRCRIHEYAVAHPPLFEETVGNISVRSFRTSHDSAMSVGYRVMCGDYDIGIITDTGYVSDEMTAALAGCVCVIIESNHDVDMLRYGPYPAQLKQRILSDRGHLSNDQCGEAMKKLSALGTEKFCLAHLSEHNNTEKAALDSARRYLCGTDSDVTCAYQDKIVRFI